MSKYANTLAARSAARVPTYNMTAEQLEQMREAARRDGLRAGVYACNAMYSVALLQALRDGLGFGKNRLKAAFERVQMLFGQIVAGEISYEDMAAVLLAKAAAESPYLWWIAGLGAVCAVQALGWRKSRKF